jgi:hypothetical protein
VLRVNPAIEFPRPDTPEVVRRPRIGDPGRVTYDDLAGDHRSGPLLCIETVERRVQYFPDGRDPITTEEPADKCSDLPVDWFVPDTSD